MKKTELFQTALRIFGLFLMLQVAHQLIILLIEVNLRSLPLYSDNLISMFLSGTLAYFAIFRTDFLMSKLPMKDEGAFQLTTTKTDLIEIALAILSIVVIIRALPDVLGHVINILYDLEQQNTEFWSSYSKKYFFQSILELIAGLWLYKNSRKLAKRMVKKGEQADQFGDMH